MKCLSLWQPWATLMVAGRKAVETRGWEMVYRGPLLIHAAKRWTGAERALCLTDPFRTALQPFGVPPGKHDWTTADMERKRAGWDLPFGAIVGRVDVVECYQTEQVDVDHQGSREPPTVGVARLCIDRRELAFGDYGPGRFATLCRNPVRFAEPIPYRGWQGMFEVPDEVIAQAEPAHASR